MSEFLLRQVTAEDKDGLAAVRDLITEYAEWLAPFVTHTTIAEELASLPAPFASPSGCLILATDANGRACGCVGIMQHEGTVCEIKRLFVRPECRGSGLGRELLASSLDAACALGYAIALVSSVPAHMEAAIHMYEQVGFTPTHRFEDHTHAEVEMLYLRFDLGDWCP